MTTRSRLTLDTLESRELYAAGLLASAFEPVPPAISVGHIRPHHQPGPSPVAHVGMMAEPQVVPAAVIFFKGNHLSVLSLRNESGRTLNVTVQWQGSTVAETYSIRPGHTQEVWTKLGAGVEHAIVAFNGGAAAGHQTRISTLSAGIEAANYEGLPTGPGHTYTFVRTPTGVSPVG